jgi:hypothetical protein
MCTQALQHVVYVHGQSFQHRKLLDKFSNLHRSPKQKGPA